MHDIVRFNDACRRYNRRINTVLLVGVVITMAVVITLIECIPSHSEMVESGQARVPAALICTLAGIPIALLIGMVFMVERRARRDPLTRCPHCEANLVQAQRLAVVTRNCVHCGRQALKEPDTPA